MKRTTTELKTIRHKAEGRYEQIAQGRHDQVAKDMHKLVFSLDEFDVSDDGDNASREAIRHLNLSMHNHNARLSSMRKAMVSTCADCDTDIKARQSIVPHATRCVECQNDHDLAESRYAGASGF